MQEKALVRPQKSIFCKLIGPHFKAQRAYISFELHENNLQTSLYKVDKLFVEDKNIFIPISLIFSRKESKITNNAQ